MTATLRIAEVADRVGISTATVRYYERIGVLPQPERADNGYRVYDDRTVERLGFIGRAKQLGCSLEDITDLVIAWDGGECGPLQDRLRQLVADKLAAARADIVGLVTLTAELERAAAALERHRPVGRCDDRCGCVTEAAPFDDEPVTVSPVALTERAGRDTGADNGDDNGAPIACTLHLDQVPERVAQWSSVLHGATRTAIDGGVRLALDRGVDVAEIARLAAAEQDCCRFFDFRLTIDDRGNALEVIAPSHATDVVHAAFGAPM